VGVKALVLRDGLVLCARKRDAEGDICTFPGGGQEPGETLVEAGRREFHEEVGRRVRVGELLFVREYIGRNHEFAATDAGVHVVDHVFRCTLLPHDGAPPAGAAPHTPWPGAAVSPNADPGQVAVEWLPVAALDEHPFRPRALQPYLRQLAGGERPTAPVYVGGVN
jgi:ADP-ribose pyrophosphatase YjhB (NUDIX family)